MERERAERRAAQKREERATEKSKLKESAPEVESVGSRLAKAKGSEPVASMSRSTRVNKRKAMLEDVLNEEVLVSIFYQYNRAVTIHNGIPGFEKDFTENEQEQTRQDLRKYRGR